MEEKKISFKVPFIISIFIILALLIYTIFIYPNRPLFHLCNKYSALIDTSAGGPIRADGGGGVKLSLTPTPSQADKIILKVEEITGLPIHVKVDRTLKATIDGNSYWCDIYDYEDPFPEKFVEIDAVVSTDPNFNNNHASARLFAVNNFDLNRTLPDASGGRSFTYNFEGGTTGKYFFIEIINQSPPTPILISGEIVGGTSVSYPLTIKRILFLDVSQSTNIRYQITNSPGLQPCNIKINVYKMNRN